MDRSLNGRLVLIAFTALLSALAAGWLSQLDAADVTLSWSDNSSNENGFEIQRKIGTSGTFIQRAIVGVNVTSYVDTGLAAATTFCYRVRAFNSAGNSAFTPEACKTTPSGAPTFDFSLVHGGNKSVTRGQSVSNVITATLTSGSSQSVFFVTSGLPTGAEASYTTSTSCNPTCSRTLNIETSSSTPTGTFTVTVTGSGGSVAKIATFDLTVTSPGDAPTFDFSLVHGGNKSVTRGQSVSNVITATLTSGSSQSVFFLTSGLPTGATAAYATSSSCNPTCSRTLNITTSSSTLTGTFPISVTGTGGDVAKTATFNLTVTSSDSSHTVALEAENGILTAPMVIRSDSEASEGKFVEVPAGKGNNYNDETKGGPGEVRFTISIPQEGTRALWARTIGLDGNSDSFYVTRNETLINEWIVPQSTTWKWNKVANLSLASGNINLAFRQREDGTKLDQIILTSDLGFIPGESTPTLATVNGSTSVTALIDTAESITTKIGVYRPSTGDFFLDRDGNGLWDGCTVDVCLKWLAQKSGVPVAGNWDGGDTTRIGTFDVATGTWYLDRNGNNQWDGCEVDTCITSFGALGDVSAVRSATGSDRPSIGVFPSAVTNTVPRKDIITNWGLWKFDASGNSISDGCQLDSCFWTYANPGDFAVVGDWDGDGIGNISVFDASRGSWLLDYNGNGLWDGCAVDKCLSNFGQMHDLPVAGDWDGTGKAMIGVFRPSTGEWFLDKNGNGQLDGCGVDTCVRSFGNPGDLPVVGKW